MVNVFDMIMAVVFAIDFSIAVGIVLAAPLIGYVTAPLSGFASTVQVINGSSILTVNSPQLNYSNTAGGVIPSMIKASISEWNSTISSGLLPVNSSQQTISVNLAGVSFTFYNPAGLVGLLFNILDLMYLFVYNMLVAAPQWVNSMLIAVFGGSNAFTNAVSVIFWFMSTVSFFWFIIMYVWQPLSWIVGLILASIASLAKLL